MKYKKLSIFSYDSIKEELKIRKNEYTTVNTKLEIYPFKNQERVNSIKYELFCNPIPEILLSVDNIFKNSNNIKEILRDIPNIALSTIIINNIIEEIQSTNSIEGVRSTRKEIGYAISNVNSNKTIKLKSIAKMYMDLISEENKIINSPKDIRDIYDSLMGELPKKDQLDGVLFRNDIVNVRNSMDEIVHVGSSSEEKIIEDITKLIDFMNNKELTFLIKCIVSHYFLEYIHPFYDGNGRLGRFLISSYLSRKLDDFTALSISNSINKDKKKYSKLFSEVSKINNYGDLTLFVYEMLRFIEKGQEDMTSQLEEASLQIKKVEDIIQENKDIDKIEKKIIFILSSHYLFDQTRKPLKDTEVFKHLDLKKPLSDYMRRQYFINLEKKGYIKKISKNPSKHQISDELIDKIL